MVFPLKLELSPSSSQYVFQSCLLANQLISEGVIAIIGPKTSTAVKAMYPVCSKFHIPLISASATDPDFFYKFKSRYNYLLRMSPTDTSMGFAMKHLIGNFKWKRMGILTSATDNGKNNYNTKQRVS